MIEIDRGACATVPLGSDNINIINKIGLHSDDVCVLVSGPLSMVPVTKPAISSQMEFHSVSRRSPKILEQRQSHI